MSYILGRDVYPRRVRRVAIAALRLWAETCKGIQVYEIVHVVGGDAHQGCGYVGGA